MTCRHFKSFLIITTIVMLPAISSPQNFTQRTDCPPVGRTDPGQYREQKSYLGGEGSIRFMEILRSGDFETNFHYVRRGVLQPKSGIGEHANPCTEEMYIVFDGPAIFSVDCHASELPPGSMVLCPPGKPHGLYNDTNKPLQWMSIGVGMAKENCTVRVTGNTISRASTEYPPRFRWNQLSHSLLKPGGPAHEGNGKILFRRLWNWQEFETNFYVVSHAVVPPGVSIGYHQHNTREEVYYLISGKGKLTANDTILEVVAGDAVPCRLHGSHGIYNDSDKDIELLVFSTAVTKGNVKFEKNLGDDLVPDQ